MDTHLNTIENQFPAKINRQRVYAIRLVPGEWKKLFSIKHFCDVIAETLNQCVYSNDLHIYGYVITYNSICLVLDNRPEAQQKLVTFYDKVKQAIIKQRKLTGLHDAENEVMLYHLFRSYKLFSMALLQLLMGKAVQLPYYNPQLERLKDRLRKQPYCSVIDYSGAEGPVAVTKLNNDTDIYFSEIEIIDVEDEYLFE